MSSTANSDHGGSGSQEEGCVGIDWDRDESILQQVLKLHNNGRLEEKLGRLPYERLLRVGRVCEGYLEKSSPPGYGKDGQSTSTRGREGVIGTESRSKDKEKGVPTQTHDRGITLGVLSTFFKILHSRNLALPASDVSSPKSKSSSIGGLVTSLIARLLRLIGDTTLSISSKKLSTSLLTQALHFQIKNIPTHQQSPLNTDIPTILSKVLDTPDEDLQLSVLRSLHAFSKSRQHFVVSSSSKSTPVPQKGSSCGERSQLQGKDKGRGGVSARALVARALAKRGVKALATLLVRETYGRKITSPSPSASIGSRQRGRKGTTEQHPEQDDVSDDLVMAASLSDDIIRNVGLNFKPHPSTSGGTSSSSSSSPPPPPNSRVSKQTDPNNFSSSDFFTTLVRATHHVTVMFLKRLGVDLQTPSVPSTSTPTPTSTSTSITPPTGTATSSPPNSNLFESTPPLKTLKFLQTTLNTLSFLCEKSSTCRQLLVKHLPVDVLIRLVEVHAERVSVLVRWGDWERKRDNHHYHHHTTTTTSRTIDLFPHLRSAAQILLLIAADKSPTCRTAMAGLLNSPTPTVDESQRSLQYEQTFSSIVCAVSKVGYAVMKGVVKVGEREGRWGDLASINSKEKEGKEGKENRTLEPDVILDLTFEECVGVLRPSLVSSLLDLLVVACSASVQSLAGPTTQTNVNEGKEKEKEKEKGKEKDGMATVAMGAPADALEARTKLALHHNV
ncbi:hypothetical protein HK102_004963, partial [Quaeritorhiza haematococci]